MINRIRTILIFYIAVLTFPSSVTFAKAEGIKNEQLTAIKKGTGAWIYESNPRFINEINAYNTMVKNPEKKIKYLFCYSGSVEKGHLVGFNNAVVDYYKQKLPGCEVYANIDAADSINGLSEREIAGLAKEIANHINHNENIAGLHLDIEPYEPTQLMLMDEYKKHTLKPVNLSIDMNSPSRSSTSLSPTAANKLFNLTNFVVLMNYDIEKEPTTYRNRSKEAIHVILESAIHNKGYIMVGLPFIATWHEYQSLVKKENRKERIQSGYTMSDFLKGGIEACNQATTDLGSTNFIGISIWAFLSEEKTLGSDLKSNPNLYYPASIGLKEWQLLLQN